VACPYKIFPLDDYKVAMASVGKELDVKFLFADEQITALHVIQKITNYIREADFCLFDITGWNPNVTLELGIALGLGKRHYILFNPNHDTSQDVPSDIKGIDRLQYASNSELEAKLILLVKQELPNPASRSDSAFELVKQSILQALSEQPGLNLSKLADVTKQDKILIQATIRGMVITGELKTKGQKKGTTYYTGTTDMRTIRTQTRRKSA